MGRFKNLIQSSPHRIPFPIATYPAIALTGNSTRQLVTDASIQSAAQLKLQKMLGTAVLLTCMDLSVEAEAFGAEVRFSDDEVPTVIGRRATSLQEIEALPRPVPGQGRTSVYLNTIRCLREKSEDRPVMAGMIGPFSLAGRLFGVSECLLATATEPEVVEALLDRTTEFLLAYANEMKASGADGVFVAEPTAGLLSPKSLGIFSSARIRTIIKAVQDSTFDVVLHNCGASAHHLDAIAESGAGIFHFGAPMYILAALRKLSPTAIVCGNLDPAAVFVQSSAEEVRQKTSDLLNATREYPLFVPSSGCDIPAATPFENIVAFVEQTSAGWQ